MYSITYTLETELAWLPDMIVAGKRFMPSQKSPLMDASLSPLKNLIWHFCGTKDIRQVTLWGPIVCTWPCWHCECMLTSISAIRIAQVCVIFKLPGYLSFYPHPLAYVEWFTSLCRCDLISHQFIVTHLACNHQCNALVISIDCFTCTCHLQAQCGRNISSDWASHNVLEVASAFHVNLYIDLDTFMALTD